VRVTLLVTFLLPAPVFAGPKPGDEGTPEYQAASELVRQLGDPKFAAREAAGKKLVDMGAAAVSALTAGTKSTDEEVRTRSAALLPKAVAVGWRRRADAFLAEAAANRDLPLLAEWEKLTGTPDAGTRKLYADVLAAAGPLLEQAADQKLAIAALVSQSKALLTGARVDGAQVAVPLGEAAAVLFVHVVLKDAADRDLQDAGGEVHPCHLLANPTVAKAIDDKDAGPAVRRLTAAWADTRLKAGDTPATELFTALAYRHPFPEADPVLAGISASKAAGTTRWLAVEALGKATTPAARDGLTRLLEDSTPVYEDRGEKVARHQVRDAALAALVRAAGKEPKAYGLKSHVTTEFAFSGPGDVVTLRLYGFDGPADREAGIKKWKAETAAGK
jgi:hypothetical protein